MHPDKIGRQQTEEELVAFEQLNKAYSVLSDNALRIAYLRFPTHAKWAEHEAKKAQDIKNGIDPNASSSKKEKDKNRRGFAADGGDNDSDSDESDDGDGIFGGKSQNAAKKKKSLAETVLGAEAEAMNKLKPEDRARAEAASERRAELKKKHDQKNADKFALISAEPSRCRKLRVVDATVLNAARSSGGGSGGGGVGGSGSETRREVRLTVACSVRVDEACGGEPERFHLERRDGDPESLEGFGRVNRPVHEMSRQELVSEAYTLEVEPISDRGWGCARVELEKLVQHTRDPSNVKSLSASTLRALLRRYGVTDRASLGLDAAGMALPVAVAKRELVQRLALAREQFAEAEAAHLRLVAWREAAQVGADGPQGEVHVVVVQEKKMQAAVNGGDVREGGASWVMETVGLRVRAENSYGFGDWSEVLGIGVAELDTLLAEGANDDFEGGHDAVGLRQALQRQKISDAAATVSTVKGQAAQALAGVRTAGLVRMTKDRTASEASLRRAHRLCESWVSRLPKASLLRYIFYLQRVTKGLLRYLDFCYLFSISQPCQLSSLSLFFFLHI